MATRNIAISEKEMRDLLEHAGTDDAPIDFAWGLNRVALVVDDEAKPTPALLRLAELRGVEHQ